MIEVVFGVLVIMSTLGFWALLPPVPRGYRPNDNSKPHPKPNPMPIPPKGEGGGSKKEKCGGSNCTGPNCQLE